MGKIKINNFTKCSIVIFIVWSFFAYPYFLHGKTPYPSDYQVTHFQPWAQYPELGSPVKNNAQPDIIGQIYPWKNFTIEEFKNGRIPFWNPYSFAGTPHLANYQSAVLSPFNLLYFLPLKFIDVWGLIVILQPLIAGFFTLLFARRLGISSYGSLISAISFMFSGFIVTWMGYSTLAYAILPLPLALWACEKHLTTRKLRYALILSLTIPLSLFSGHFQTSLYFIFALLLYCLIKSFNGEKKGVILQLVFFIICGIFISMPQLLPSIEFYALSVRSEIFQKIEAIPISYLPTLIAPDYFGNPVTRNDWFGHYAEWNGFTGSITLILAAFALFIRKNRAIIYFGVLGLISLLFAYDTPFLSFLINLKVPVISTSSASRIIVLFSFSVAMLSGFGFDNVFSLLIKRKKELVVLFILIVITLTCIWLGTYALPGDKVDLARKNLILPTSTLIGFCLLVAFGLRLNKRFFHVIAIVLICLVSFEMVRFVSKWQSFSDVKNVYYPVPITKFYKKLNDIDRVVGLSGAEDSLHYRIPILSGYDPLYKAEYGEFIQFSSVNRIIPPGRSVVSMPLSGENSRELINFMGVKYVVHKALDNKKSWAFPFSEYPSGQFEKVYDDKIYSVYKNKKSYPRAFAVTNVISTDSKNAAAKLIFNNELAKVAVTYEEVLTLNSESISDIRIQKYAPGEISIDASTNGKQFLVLTDNYYPGWSATVNGHKQKIYKTNYSFMGLVIPVGESKIEFSYFPKSFNYGIYFATVGLLGIIVIFTLRTIGKK